MIAQTLIGLGPELLAITWSEFAVGTILMVMRVYTNTFMVRRWSAGFWWALATYVSAVLGTAFLTVSVNFGYGDHLEDLLAQSPQLIPKILFYQWIFTTFGIVGIALGKMAIIALLLQIEGTSGRNMRKWVLYVFATSNIIASIILIPIIWVQCTPTAKMWDNELPGNCAGRAVNQACGYFVGSFYAVLDFVLALYPIIIFWNLQLRLHVKIGLAVLFSFGVVAAVCAAIKTAALSTLTATSDITYQLASLGLWTSTEMWIVFIVSCIPTVRIAFVKVIKKGTGSQSRTFPIRHGYTAQNDSYTNESRVHAYVQTGRKVTDSRNTLKAMESSSQENILPGQTGIMMTRDIRVQYSKDNPEGSLDKSVKDSEIWKNGFDDRV